MHVDSAAPMPVPVQMRIPRLNIAEACPTPATTVSLQKIKGNVSEHTKLEFSGPHRLGWVVDKGLSKVALDATDHVMVRRLSTLAYDSKGVIFHDGCSADSPEKALLHSAVEAENSNRWGWLVDS